MNYNFSENTIQLRPVLPSDQDFLKMVYFSTREKEMERVSHWTAEMKEAFLNQQFNAQHNYYHSTYLEANFLIILYKNMAIGRLYIDEFLGNKDIRIIDISILPNWRNKGIGKSILTEILNQAKSQDKKVSIHVESFNPAMHLYKRLGFEKVSETNGVYHLLEYNHHFEGVPSA